MQTPSTIRLFGFRLSGHSHRVELFLSLLGLAYEFIAVDLPGKEQKSAQMLALNPRGQVPVIVDGDVSLYDSTAILVYLAKRYGNHAWLPEDALGAARVQQFLSLASGEVLEGPARARLITLFQAPLDHALAKNKAHALLSLLEGAHAPEGGVSLAEYAHVQAWIARIEALPKFLAMPASPHAA